MTTIACDGRAMVGDGRTTDGGDIIVCDEAVKVERLGDGSLMGFSGQTSRQRTFVNWYNRPEGDRGTLEGKFSALVLALDGTVRIYDGDGNALACAVPAAIGSGREIALGVMAAGKTAEEAVAIASRYDPFTGGRVTALRLGEAE